MKTLCKSALVLSVIFGFVMMSVPMVSAWGMGYSWPPANMQRALEQSQVQMPSAKTAPQAQSVQYSGPPANMQRALEQTQAQAPAAVEVGQAQNIYHSWPPANMQRALEAPATPPTGNMGY
jgi:hypothetical protein